MNRKKIWLVLPVALLPYIVLCATVIPLFSTKVPLLDAIMENVFQDNALYLVSAVLLFALIAAVLSVLCFTVSIRKQWDALSLAKTAMIIKLIQVPAYILIFILGVLLMITIFTIPFSIGMLILNCLTLVLTGLLSIAAVVIAIRQNYFTLNDSLWIVVLQLIFCADVFASIALYRKLKKKRSMPGVS